MTDTPSPRTLAAIDLGSNSFHMIVANVDNGNIAVVDRIRESVRLAAGLDEQMNISAEASERALACLQRFGERLRGLPEDAVRAVGTNTLRKAKDSARFLARARVALGYDIETITGLEEARLIYLGVAHSMAGAEGRRLVVDIGGGSTEVILGEQFETLYRESLYMGCVSMSQRWFGDGKLTEKAFRKARIQAKLELRPVRSHFMRIGWQTAIGASGTIKAIGRVSEMMGWTDGSITPESLANIRTEMITAGHLDNLQLKGLSEERVPVFAGGVVVLDAVFDALGIERMIVSDGALREGLLYDHIGRISHADVRDNAIRGFSDRFNVDHEHARRVSRTAMRLYRDCAVPWGLEDEELVDLLGWAAEVHEAGMSIAHSGYHKHGAYLVKYTDLAGFTREQQQALAALIRSHRRRFASKHFEGFPEEFATRLRYLAILLRLAVLLHRSRRDRDFEGLRLKIGDNSLKLIFAEGWLHDHPLNRADLNEEKNYLAESGFKLRFE